MERVSEQKIYGGYHRCGILSVFILTICFFIFPTSEFAISFPNTEPFSPNIGNQALFDIEAVGKITEVPVQWVTAGAGVLAYGAGQHVYFAPEETPNVIIASLTFDHKISEALILGKHAFLSEEGLGLRILDLEDPSNPTDLGSYDLPGTVFHLASRGNFLFVGGQKDGVRVLEVFPRGHEPSSSVPPFPFEERGLLPIEEAMTAVTISADGRAYIAAGGGIGVYDVLDPSQLVQIDDIPFPVPIKSMAVNGNHLFLATGTEGLLVLDVSTPGSTAILARYDIPAESLCLAGRQVYVGGKGGLDRFRAGPVTAATFDVQVANNQFIPARVNIATGDTVKWTWVGDNHSTTSGQNCNSNGIWNSGVQGVGFTFTHTFSTPGTFPYFCSVHCIMGMVGTVKVVTPGVSISINPSPVSFGKVTAGQSSDKFVTIKNQATSTKALTGTVGTLSPPFSLVGGGTTFSLDPGQSTLLTVRFSPTSAGLSSGTLAITHNAMNRSSPANISLTGNAVTTSVALADLLLSPVSGPTTGVIGKTIPVLNTVTNQGTAPATNVTVRFYISDTPSLTPHAVLVGSRFLLLVKPGASKTATTNVVIPTGLAPGSYFVGAIIDPGSTVRESDKTNNTTFDLAGIVICRSLSRPVLLSPLGGATNVSTTPTLDWMDVAGATSYEVEVATDPLFTSIVASISGLVASQWIVTPALSGNTTHFWRVRASNQCTQGPRSFKRRFRTGP
jgi:plastocyanin